MYIPVLQQTLQKEKYTYYLTGRELVEDRFIPKNISKEPVLKVENLTLKDQKCKDISFDLKKGEILGVTGLLGSGRTELALTLLVWKILHPDALN